MERCLVSSWSRILPPRGRTILGDPSNEPYLLLVVHQGHISVLVLLTGGPSGPETSTCVYISRTKRRSVDSVTSFLCVGRRVGHLTPNVVDGTTLGWKNGGGVVRS